MFNLFKKDPLKKLISQHDQLTEKAFQAQRNGNIKLYSELSFDAQELLKKIEELKKINEK